MSTSKQFTRGTKLVCTSIGKENNDFYDVEVGGVYEVTIDDESTYRPLKVAGLWINRDGITAHGYNFKLAPEEPVELERLPQNRAAELLIEGIDPIQYYLNCEWHDVNNAHKLTVHDLRRLPFRIKPKPKTVVINGVTVLAPLKLEQGTRVYYPDIGRGNVQEAYVGGTVVNYWATAKDAQAVLNAMLLPFK